MFEEKYRALGLETVYGRKCALDIFYAWGMFIDSDPDIGPTNHPAHVLLIGDDDCGYGPFMRWVLGSDSDSDHVIALKAALEDRVARFIEDERQDDLRKRALNQFHRYYRYECGGDVKARVQRATRDYFVNERCASAHDGWKYSGFMQERKIIKRQPAKIPWLLEYVRMHRNLAEYDEAFAAGRDEASALLSEWDAFYETPVAYAGD